MCGAVTLVNSNGNARARFRTIELAHYIRVRESRPLETTPRSPSRLRDLWPILVGAGLEQAGERLPRVPLELGSDEAREGRIPPLEADVQPIVHAPVAHTRCVV